MNAYAWLVVGIVVQCAGLAALRVSGGLRRPWLTFGAYVGLVGATLPVGLAIDAGMSLAVAYSLWTGAGIAFAAVGGAVLFGDRLSRLQSLGLALLLLGVVFLETGG